MNIYVLFIALVVHCLDAWVGGPAVSSGSGKCLSTTSLWALIRTNGQRAVILFV